LFFILECAIVNHADLVLVKELIIISQRAKKFARNSTKVLHDETIKSDFGGFFLWFGWDSSIERMTN
jgi:hypothetical protein